MILGNMTIKYTSILVNKHFVFSFAYKKEDKTVQETETVIFKK
jgi:hypothetical protein